MSDITLTVSAPGPTVDLAVVAGTSVTLTVSEGGGVSTHAGLSDLATSGHPASVIAFTPTGSIAATTVQAAVAEVATDAAAAYQPLDSDLTAIAALTAPATSITNAIPKTLVDAAGDLLVGSAADTLARLPMGSASQVLRVNSGATGLEYATPSAGVSPSPYPVASGFYYVPGGVSDYVTFTANAIAAPMVMDIALTAVRIGVMPQNAGGAGSLIRLGIYTDVNGKPNTLVVDAGTIDGNSAIYQEVTISTALAVGRYWLVAAHNNVGTARVYGGRGMSVPAIYASGQYDAGGIFLGGIGYGALPASPGAPIDYRAVQPRINVKFS